MYKIITSLIITFLFLLLVSEAHCQTVTIYNEHSRYGSYRSEYYDRPYSTYHIVPYYSGPVWYSPTTAYSMYHAQGRAERLAWNRIVYGAKIIEKEQARYRNRVRKSGEAWLTMYDE